MRKVLLLIAVSISVVAWLVYRKQRANELVVGFSYFQDTMLPKVGEWRGWYQGDSIRVRLVPLDWSKVATAVSTGQVDVAIGNECTVIGAYNSDRRLRYLYGVNTFDNGFALMVRNDGSWRLAKDFLAGGVDSASVVDSVAAQLRGKLIVTTQNSDMEQGVVAAAQRGGLVYGSDVKVINYEAGLGLKAFIEKGVGDGYVGGVPQRLAASKAGAIALLTGNELGPAPINGFIALEETYRTRKREVLGLVHVWFRIVNAIEKDSTIASQLTDSLRAHGNEQFSVADFWSFWNKIEHYPSSPESVRSDILDSSGRNFWKRRWDSCNNYFADIVTDSTRIPAKVPYSASFVDRVHADYLAEYGARGK